MEPQLKLQYSHNVIEHLGIKLYQNKPTNVLAELISNAWDAYAENAYIDLHQDENYISIFDDGYGMTYDELVNNYLIIGKHKRVSNDDNKKLEKKYSRLEEIADRGPMGRKGIGKLAPFGISTLISLITVSLDDSGNNKVTWIELDLNEMVKKENEGEELITDYSPNIILENVDYSQDIILDQFEKNNKHIKDINKESVEKFLKKIENSGTLILLNNLTLKKDIGKESLISSMGRRFTVTLLRDDFSVFIDNEKVEEDNALPKFEFRLPEEGFSTELIDVNILDKTTQKVNTVKKELRFWVGIVKSAEWSSDEAGVGVYSHGKIAQDRPFTFKSKGREIFTRYMYAVVEADWLDELDEDVISTDRTNLNWDADELKNFADWGQKKVGEWVKTYLDKREKDDDIELLQLVEKTITSKPFTLRKSEQKGIADLIKKIAPSISKDNKTKEEIIETVSKAWTHEPMRKIIQNIWKSIQKENKHDQFIDIIQNLNNHLIPESLSLAVTFSQRTYGLSLLHDLIHTGREVDVQVLIEKFPWILEKEMELLTADKSLKTVISEAINKGLFPRRTNASQIGAMQRQEPDFIFMSGMNRSKIVVIEIKNPKNDLVLDNKKQLEDYIDHLDGIYPQSEITGLLIGKMPNDMKNKREDIVILPWTDILIKSRSEHLILLASMIRNSEPSDRRIADIKDFGGEETWELLHQMAQQDEELKELMEGFEAISKKSKAKKLPSNE